MPPQPEPYFKELLNFMELEEFNSQRPITTNVHKNADKEPASEVIEESLRLIDEQAGLLSRTETHAATCTHCRTTLNQVGHAAEVD